MSEAKAQILPSRSLAWRHRGSWRPDAEVSWNLLPCRWTVSCSELRFLATHAIYTVNQKKLTSIFLVHTTVHTGRFVSRQIESTKRPDNSRPDKNFVHRQIGVNCIFSVSLYMSADCWLTLLYRTTKIFVGPTFISSNDTNTGKAQPSSMHFLALQRWPLIFWIQKITATPGCLAVFSCVSNSLWLYSFYRSWIIVQIHCE